MAFSREEFVAQLIEIQTGVKLDDDQRRFLELIKKNGVRIRNDQAWKNDPGCQKLTEELRAMYERKEIPAFELVDA